MRIFVPPIKPAAPAPAMPWGVNPIPHAVAPVPAVAPDDQGEAVHAEPPEESAEAWLERALDLQNEPSPGGDDALLALLSTCKYVPADVVEDRYNLDVDKELAFATMKELKSKELHPKQCVGKEWDESRKREIDSWTEHDVFRRIRRHQVPGGIKTLPIRWVYTRKDSGKAKSRLTLRGDIESRRIYAAGEEAPPTDSPTVSRVAFRIFVALAAMLGWVLWSFDVPTAFLQQEYHHIAARGRPLYVQPPPEARLTEDEVWILNKIAYGMGDAPRAWYLSFSTWIEETLGGSATLSTRAHGRGTTRTEPSQGSSVSMSMTEFWQAPKSFRVGCASASRRGTESRITRPEISGCAV